MNKNGRIIRASMKEFLAAILAGRRHARSLAACHNLIHTKEFKNAQMIMISSSPCPARSKPAPRPQGLAGRQKHRRPASIGTPKMEPVEIQSLDTDMQTSAVGGGNAPGVSGIREPISGKVVPLGLIDMVVIPGLAFDRRGFRVGRGRGFYDRFLAQQDFQGIRAALCFHEQLQQESVPCEPHDIPMNLIVTDKEVVHCTGHSGRPH